MGPNDREQLMEQGIPCALRRGEVRGTVRGSCRGSGCGLGIVRGVVMVQGQSQNIRNIRNISKESGIRHSIRGPLYSSFIYS